MTLQKTNCYLCDNPMAVDKSVLVGHCFKKYIEDRVKQYGSKEELVNQNKVINILTKHYLNQFNMDDHNVKIDFLNTPSDDLYKLEVVLSEIEEGKELYLATHYGCMVQGSKIFEIPLDEINTPSKASAWTKKLKEGNSFNPIGWTKTLGDLL